VLHLIGQLLIPMTVIFFKFVISVRGGHCCHILQVSENLATPPSPVSDAYANTIAYMCFHYDMYRYWITLIKMNSAIW
jgi:hypothetical protein